MKIQRNEAPRPETPLVEELRGRGVLAEQATHNTISVAYMAGVIDLLEKRYVPPAQREYTNEKVNEKITNLLTQANKEGVSFTEEQKVYFKGFATRKQDQFDSAIFFKDGEEHTIELPMNKVVYLLLCAYEDNDHFKHCVTFKQRMEKLHGWLANTINRKQVCNVGRRNDFIEALLHQDYLLEKQPHRCVEVIQDVVAHLQDQLSSLFESRWEALYQSKPDIANKILLEWVTAIETGYFDEFYKTGTITESGDKREKQINFEEELFLELQKLMDISFINPSQWKDGIQKVVAWREEVVPPRKKFGAQIQALAEVNKFISLQERTNKASDIQRAYQFLIDHFDVATFTSPRTKVVSVLYRLYQLALPYRNLRILATGQAEQEFFEIAHEIIRLYEHQDLLPWFLGDTKAGNPFSGGEDKDGNPVNTLNIEALEARFSDLNTAYRAGISAEIEDSFAVLAQYELHQVKEQKIRFNSYKQKIADAGLLLDEAAFQAWYSQFLQLSEDQQSLAITLSPLAVNKIIWQGLMTCPSQWTTTFKVAFGQVLALLKKLEQEAGEIQSQYRLTSFPKMFIKQLEWLLRVAQHENHDIDIQQVPSYYLPCTITGCSVSDFLKVTPSGTTVFSWALFNRHIEFLLQLLSSDNLTPAILNNKIMNSVYFLHCAIAEGQLEVVRLLVEKLSPESLSQKVNNRTALLEAVKYNRLDIVRLLLEKLPPQSLSQKDEGGRTALHWAADMGRLDIVRVLLEKLPPDSLSQKDDNNQTALHQAFASGHVEVIRVLLEKIPPQALNQESDLSVLLKRAVTGGHSEVVRMLLNRLSEETLSQMVRVLQKQLSVAASAGHTEVFRLLLEQLSAKYVNQPDSDMCTPFSKAVVNGHTEIVRILLESDKLDKKTVNRPDESKYTPFARAVQGRHVEIVRALLESNKLDREAVNGKSAIGSLFYWSVVHGQNLDIIKLLLATNNLSAEAAHAEDNEGHTALMKVARSGRAAIVKELLDSEFFREESVVNKQGKKGETALFLAAESGHASVVKLLLERLSAKAVMQPDNKGKTALEIAVENGHADVVKVMLEKLSAEEVCKSYGNNIDWTLLRNVSAAGKVEVVQVFLESEKCPAEYVGSANRFGPLHFAAQEGHTEVVKLLLASDKLHPDVVSKPLSDGRNVLHLAVNNGHLEVVRALLASEKLREEVLRQPNNEGDTPLTLAAKKGHVEICKLLQETDKHNSKKAYSVDKDRNTVAEYDSVIDNNPSNVQRDFLSWLLFNSYYTVLGPFVFYLKDKLFNTKTSHFKEGLPANFISTYVKNRLLNTYVINGYHPESGQVTCADGVTAPLNFSTFRWWVWIFLLLGVPTRPAMVKDNVPVFTFMQILRNFIGGWNDVFEITSNKFGIPRFSQLRWTEKKRWQYFFLIFKLSIILPLKLVLMPIRLFINAFKFFSEFLLPFVTVLAYVLNFKLLRQTVSWAENLTLSRCYWIIPIVFFSLINIVFAAFQYAMVLVCRAALAFTSPGKSAYLAFYWGRSLTLGKGAFSKVISYLMGGLGALVSIALSALLWTLALPLILGGIVTIFPSLLSAIQGIAQWPIISATIKWFSQFSAVSVSVAWLQQAFGVVVNAAVSILGPVITTTASFLSVQIPTLVLSLSTAIGMIIVPVAAVLINIGNGLSNVLARWVESGPLSFLRSCSAPSVSNDDIDEENDFLLVSLNAGALESDPKKKKSPPYVSVYQPEKGGEYVVSEVPLIMTAKTSEILQSVELTGEEAQRMWARAQNGDKARMPRADEKTKSREYQPRPRASVSSERRYDWG